MWSWSQFSSIPCVKNTFEESMCVGSYKLTSEKGLHTADVQLKQWSLIYHMEMYLLLKHMNKLRKACVQCYFIKERLKRLNMEKHRSI
ncbi:unnamed protein product [Arctogadus glacialis]